jgi:PAS domain S-box-containing protein
MQLTVGCLIAALFVATAAIATVLLRKLFPDLPDSLFYCAVMLSAWRGGLGPGLMASVLASVAVVLWMAPPPPVRTTGWQETPPILMFLFAGVFISWLCGRPRRTLAALQEAHDELEQRFSEQTEALAASETKLKDAQRLANMGFWERDLLADRIVWSEGTCRIFGLTAPSHILKQAELEEIIHPDDRQIQRQTLNETVQCGRSYDVEYRVVRPDGNVRFIQVRDEVKTDRAGRSVRLFGTVHDITERKKMEAELVLHEQRLNAFFTDAPAGLVLLDKHLRYLQLNNRVAEINGVPVQDHLGKTVREVLPQFAPVIEPLLKQVLATGKPMLNMELSGEKPGRSGVPQHLLESIFPISGKDGNPDGLGVILVDITERKRAEDRLKVQEQEIRMIVENTRDWIIRFDTSQRLTYVNPAAVKAIGLTKEALLGNEPGSVVRENALKPRFEEIAGVKRALQQVLETGQPLNVQAAWTLPTGNGYFTLHLEPEFDAHGALTSILAIARDITELTTHEEKLRQTQAELARAVRLTAMGELTASIAHEVNQPLMGVVTNADAATRWLAAVPPNLEEARQAVGRIARDGNRASEVIKRIRTLMKKGIPARIPVNLNELIKETIAVGQAELDRQQVRLKVELAAELPCVTADRVQLQQVILNLAMNALDSLSAVADCPRVLRLRTDRPEPNTVRVAVADTGCGIAPQEIERIFEPFYTTKPQGLGMGLAISRSIVEAHGGRLWATQHDGPGVTFQFTLPIHDGGAS